MIGVKLGPVRINAGPVGSLNIGSPKELINDVNVKEMYATMTFGYQAGVGLDLFKKLTFDARFAGGLGDLLGDAVTIGTQTFNLDYSQTTFQLSLGWIF